MIMQKYIISKWWGILHLILQAINISLPWQAVKREKKKNISNCDKNHPEFFFLTEILFTIIQPVIKFNILYKVPDFPNLESKSFNTYYCN